MFVQTGWILLITLFFTACSSTPKRSAPIVDISPSGHVRAIGSGVPGNGYVVKQGENLYRIALEHGLAYRDLAAWNNLEDVNNIKAGQWLRLSDPEDASAKALVVTGTKNTPTVSTKPLGESISIATNKKEPSVSAVSMTRAPTLIGDDIIKMRLPAQGRVIASFTENSKGIDIGGKIGQAITAAADGHVVYSGAGLRGYGKVIILKHNKTYLTAYAHNNKLLVKEGDSVTVGQKIAEMGKSDTECVKLHFEVRRFGKPVDPTTYLQN